MKLPVKLEVSFGEESGGYLALYSPETQGLYIAPTLDVPMHTVCVRMDADVMQVVDSLAHEMRHAWQYESGTGEVVVRNRVHQFIVDVVGRMYKKVSLLQYTVEWAEVDARVYASWYVSGDDMPCPTVPRIDTMRELYPSLSDGELRVLRARKAYQYERAGMCNDVIC